MKRFFQFSLMVFSSIVIVFGMTSTINAAALPAGTLLTIDRVFEGATSYFTMAASTAGKVTVLLNSTKLTDGTPLPTATDGGILLLTDQPKGTGSHTGAPVYPADYGPIDKPWSFFSNTGHHFQNLASGGISVDPDLGTVNMAGWRVSWNGIPTINMGGDPVNFPVDTGIGTFTLSGNHYTLDFDAHVPKNDASGFGGVAYGLHLEGRVFVTDLCAGVNCDDSNACTDESCDAGTGNCINNLDCSLPGCDSTVDPRCDLCNGVVCTDGDACNGLETCDPNTGLCVAGTPPDCDDFNICTEDSCNPATGCVNTVIPPETGTCPRGDVWETPVTGGVVRFYDWGYTGPGKNGCAKGAPGCTDWRDAMTFNAIDGFGGPAEGNPGDPTGGIGQIQHVATLAQDWLTPDPPHDILADFLNDISFSHANMDGNVNFYKWGYTTPGFDRRSGDYRDAYADYIAKDYSASSKPGCTFDPMLIDYDGDYFVPKPGMNFAFYDLFNYRDMTGVNPDQTFDTRINFQPFPISDGIGWCGSVLASHPAALDIMAGQITFDFAFEAYLPTTPLGENGLPDPGEGSVQIVPGFKMGSYGTLEVAVKASQGGAGDLHFIAGAVGNNTNPALGRDSSHPLGYLGPNYYNRVTFTGGDVVPRGVWVYQAGYGTHAVQVHPIQDPPGTTPGEIRVDPVLGNAIWHENSFKGYPFILRADGVRMVDYFDASRYGADTDLDAVPDSQDNCINAANGPAKRDAGGNVQRDSNGDGYGNLCDADLNNNGIINSLDLGLFKAAYMTANADADLNGNGIVNSLDLGLFKGMFMKAPGPSGLVP